MPKYLGKELTRFKEKTGGKNQSVVDGLYQDDNGARYFIKKPDDKRELFAELFAGLLIKEFMMRKLIDEVYFPSLIIADFIVFDDGSYGLIQPMVSFTELHKIIGTSYADGSDRNGGVEAFYGPHYYQGLLNQPQYFGLSTALLFSLLFSAHSVHSGNLVSLNHEGRPSTQYARLDWGDAFRNFAHPENNANLLYAYENRGHLNYKKFTKDYFLNFKNINGLFPAMAEKALLLQNKVTAELLQEIINSALEAIPSNLIDKGTQDEFAQYTAMDSFKQVAFGFVQEHNPFIDEMAKVLLDRLQKITQITDLSPTTNRANNYKSTILIIPPILSLGEEDFSQAMRSWHILLSKKDKAQTIETRSVHLVELAQKYNEYLKALLKHCEEGQLLQSNPLSTNNILAPFNTKTDGLAQFGYAFVNQYKEAVIFSHLFLLDLKKVGTLGFMPYENLSNDYLKKFPNSLWAKLQTLATISHSIIQGIRAIQTGQSFGLDEMIEENLPLLRTNLNDFVKLHVEVSSLVMNAPRVLETSSQNPSFFYPMDDACLLAMTGDQLATICLEEANHQHPSSLVFRILKNDRLWQKLETSFNSGNFTLRPDSPQTKIAEIQQWRKLLQMEMAIQRDRDEVYAQQLEKQAIQIRELTNKNELLEQEVVKERSDQVNNKLQFETSQQQEITQRETQFKRLIHMASVFVQLEAIEQKTLELQTRGATEAVNAATILVTQMRTAITSYVTSDLSNAEALDQFKKITPKLITDANLELGEHRQYWKYVLANLSLAIASLVIGYIAAACINKAMHGQFTFFGVTKSKELVDTLDERIANVVSVG